MNGLVEHGRVVRVRGLELRALGEMDLVQLRMIIGVSRIMEDGAVIIEVIQDGISVILGHKFDCLGKLNAIDLLGVEDLEVTQEWEALLLARLVLVVALQHLPVNDHGTMLALANLATLLGPHDGSHSVHPAHA